MTTHRTTLAFLFYFVQLCVIHVFAVRWAWIGGSNYGERLGVYGERGVPSITNIPGARSSTLGWYDSASQELWIFGGYGYSSTQFGWLNDLWRYRMNDLTWTWMSGSDITADLAGEYGEITVANTTNFPGGRGYARVWYDSTNQEFWVFGGYDIRGYLNDLWRYRVSDNTWTWMSGSNSANQRGIYGEKGVADSANIPGARQDPVVWYDSTNQEVWLFGGYGYDGNGNSGYLNDLWKYHLKNNTWTWIAGGNSTNQKGVYGNKGSANPANVPGGRYGTVGWFDSLREEFWVFAGYGRDGDNIHGYLNDLWRYDVTNSTWTWMSGDSTAKHPGIYGEKGNGSPSNTPGSRFAPSGWYDSLNQEFWVFGGYGCGNDTEQGALNDLWRYRVGDSTWTWMSGSPSVDQPGVYGAKVQDSTWTWIAGDHNRYRYGIYGEKGTGNTNNLPGPRSTSTGWYDSSTQELWLFGGYGTGEEYEGYLNDLWRYGINDETWTWMGGSKSPGQSGKYGEKGIASSDNIPSGRYNAVGGYDSTRQLFWLFGGYGYGASSTSLGHLNDLWMYRMNDSTWTWMSGNDTVNQEGVYGTKGNASVENVPGAREYAVGWFDSSRQEFWVFGGLNSFGYFNDMWRYQVDTGLWTWMSGSDQMNQPGIYGEKGNASTDHVPSARCCASGWYDSTNQEFWLFGGRGYGQDSFGYLNDLWRYRVSDNTWTWMSGNDSANQRGVYGEKGVSRPSNVPGARYGAAVWFDDVSQEFWLFGGHGYSDISGDAELNDFWVYRVNDSTWTWVGGSNNVEDLGVYGKKGEASPDYFPPPRQSPQVWYDSSTRTAWLFGGYSAFGDHNDFWKVLLLDLVDEVREGLSAGAIVGIVIGCLIAVALIAVIVYVVVKKK